MSDKKHRIGFEMDIGQADAKPRQESRQGSGGSTEPFSIAILGDFSGRNNRQQYEHATIAKRRLIQVDRDNLDEALSGFDVELRLWLDDDAEEPVLVPIKSLDDFHPDQLYQHVEVFGQLRVLRNRLKNNKTFAEAARELQAWLGQAKSTDSSGETRPSVPQPPLSQEGLLDSVFEASQQMQSSSDTAAGEAMIDNLVKQIVAPYVEARPDPRQEEMLVAVDEAVAAHMRFILHHPDFQALEAAWRGLDFLVRRADVGPQVRLYIMDVAQHELEVDLDADNVTSTALYQRFADPAPGEVNWGLILGNYRFTDRVEDIMTLLQIGAVARKARAPFIAAVNERLIGCESFAITPDVQDWQYRTSAEVESAWSLLRQSDEAAYLALVVPGFLLRAPYGQRSKPIEAFPFEEMPPLHCHSCYLWGNGALIKAEQMVRAFVRDGWDNMDPTCAERVEGLPVHYYSEGGEGQVKPCAEILLSEQGGRRILARGLIPLWSVKNSDSVRSSAFHSLAG